MLAEQKLWQSVVLQAVQDALRDRGRRAMDTQRDIDEARSFLTAGGEWRNSLNIICDMAGLCPEYVRDKYNRLRENHQRVRARANPEKLFKSTART